MSRFRDRRLVRTVARRGHTRRALSADVIAVIDDDTLIREVGRRSRDDSFSIPSLVRRVGDADLVSELARRDHKGSLDAGSLQGRLPSGQQTQLLAVPDDELLVIELLRRADRSGLGASVDPKLLGALVGGFRPTRRLAYDRHEVELAVTSAASYKRVAAADKEPFTVAWLERSVRPGDTVYDIGANVGAYALIAAKLGGGRTTVYAFEPSGPNLADLCRNIALNDCADTVIPLPVALWSRTGLASFDYRSFDPGEAGHSMSDDESTAASGSELRVLAFRLDDLRSLFDLPQPNLIKLDVDGPELKVLEGAIETISHPGCREVMIEINGASDDPSVLALQELLTSCGFSRAERHDRGLSGGDYELFAKA